jgi:hypothetical protein
MNCDIGLLTFWSKLLKEVENGTNFEHCNFGYSLKLKESSHFTAFARSTVHVAMGAKGKK